MKTKISLILFMIAMSFLVKAESQFRRDYSSCEFKNEKVGIELLSRDQFASSEDDDYGDILQINHNGKKHAVILNDDGIGRYKLLLANNEFCSKVLAIPTKDSEVAFFVLKDNRPMPHKLIVLYYNLKTKVTEFVPSIIKVNEGLYQDGRAFFKLAADDTREKSGKIKIGKDEYNFVEKVLEPWISFDGRRFKLDYEMTYNQFEQKAFVQKSTFENLREFQEAKYQLAIHPESQRRCLSIATQKWNCL